MTATPPDPSSGPPPSRGDISQLLAEASRGNRNAFDRLMPLVYQELARLAHSKLRRERPGHTLDTGALVHEAYLKLVDQRAAEWKGRHHFYAVASEVMRRILIDYAKHRGAIKRGSGAPALDLDSAGAVPADLLTDDEAIEMLALDAALRRLAAFNPDGAEVVQHRFFGGLSNEEVAEVLGTSERSVRRAWVVARAWLRRELSSDLPSGSTFLGPGAPRTKLD